MIKLEKREEYVDGKPTCVYFGIIRTLVVSEPDFVIDTKNYALKISPEEAQDLLKQLQEKLKWKNKNM